MLKKKKEFLEAMEKYNVVLLKDKRLIMKKRNILISNKNQQLNKFYKKVLHLKVNNKMLLILNILKCKTKSITNINKKQLNINNLINQIILIVLISMVSLLLINNKMMVFLIIKINNNINGHKIYMICKTIMKENSNNKINILDNNQHHRIMKKLKLI